MNAQEFIDALVVMGADVSFNRLDGLWYAGVSEHRMWTWGADPVAAVADLHSKWLVAGCPAPRLRTPEEAAAIEAWHATREAVVAQADLPPYPYAARPTP